MSKEAALPPLKFRRTCLNSGVDCLQPKSLNCSWLTRKLVEKSPLSQDGASNLFPGHLGLPLAPLEGESWAVEGEVVKAWVGRYAPVGVRRAALDCTASQTLGNYR